MKEKILTVAYYNFAVTKPSVNMENTQGEKIKKQHTGMKLCYLCFWVRGQIVGNL